MNTVDSMLRVVNIEENNLCCPGVLLRLKCLPEEAAEDLYCLVMQYRILPSSARSSLDQIVLYAPNENSKIKHEWVRRVWGDKKRGVTFVQLTHPAVQWLLAMGATCRTVGIPAKGMRATQVICVMKDKSSFKLNEDFAEIDRVEDKTLELKDMTTLSRMLVGPDGSLLAMRKDAQSSYYSLLGIVDDFLKDRLWQIRYCSLEIQH